MLYIILSDSVVNPMVSIERTTFRHASISWTMSSSESVDQWQIKIAKTTSTFLSAYSAGCGGLERSWYFYVDGDTFQFDLPLTFQASQKYTVAVTAMKRRSKGDVKNTSTIDGLYVVSVLGAADFKAGANRIINRNNITCIVGRLPTRGWSAEKVKASK